MKDLFIISDIHGKIDSLEALLSTWNPSTQRLVLAGDLVDRGKDSLAVVRLAMSLYNDHDAIILKGNHEEMFLDWLNSSDDYCNPDTMSTIKSFVGEPYCYLKTPGMLRKNLRNEFSDEMAFLENLDLFHETRSHIIVHAGLDLTLSDWKDTSEADMLWIREEFHKGVNKTGKTIIFGHTPTRHLRQEAVASNDVWVAPCGTKICIDGGAYFGGSLNGLIVTENGYRVAAVDNNLTITEKALLI